MSVNGISVRMPPDIEARVRRLARDTERTISRMVVALIREALTQREGKTTKERAA